MAGIVITGDANIDLLDYAVLFDMSGVGGTLPFMVITNLSSGGDLDACAWWVKWTSPAGNVIHQGSQGTPDFPAATPFVTFDTDSEGIIWPQPQNHIEWGIYSVEVYVFSPDTNKTYSFKKQINICAPHGNTATVGNNFGQAKLDINVVCKDSIILANDSTVYVYQGKTGVSETDYPKWLLHYPPVGDDTVIQPDDAEVEGASSAIFAALVNGPSHYIDYTNVVEYDMDNDVTLLFKYKKKSVFDVWCNLDINPLICAYQAYQLDFSKCDRTASNYGQLAAKDALLQRKINILLMSMMQTTDSCCNVDLYALVEEIKKLAGFDCDCYGQGVGASLNLNVVNVLSCFADLDIDTVQPLSTQPGLNEALQQAICDIYNNPPAPPALTGLARNFPIYTPVTGIGLAQSALLQIGIGDPGLIDSLAPQIASSASFFLNGNPRLRYAKYTDHNAGVNGSYNPILEFRGPSNNVYHGIGLVYDQPNELYTATQSYNNRVKEVQFNSDGTVNSGAGAPFVFNNRIKTADPNGANSAGFWKLGKVINVTPGVIDHTIRVNIDGVNYKIGAVIE